MIKLILIFKLEKIFVFEKKILFHNSKDQLQTVGNKLHLINFFPKYFFLRIKLKDMVLQLSQFFKRERPPPTNFYPGTCT